MAELTLSERATMANTYTFQQRMFLGIRKKANYWKDFVPSTVAEFNRRTQKRKQFAHKVLNALTTVNIVAYCEFFLNQYNADPPDLDGSTPPQITDIVITDDGAADASFDYFAGVRTGDDTGPYDYSV